MDHFNQAYGHMTQTRLNARPGSPPPAGTLQDPPPREAALTESEALALAEVEGVELEALLARAASLRDAAHGRIVTYSRKVFIPLTTYCRDDCGYCTFKRDPGQPGAGYLTPAQVLDIARAGAHAGCKEALFSLGDKPELRWPQARADLSRLGYASTTDYLAAMCALVLEQTGLIPHANPGTLSRRELETLRPVCGSMGIMLEQTAPSLRAPGGAHHGAPDKVPGARLATLRFAGELGIPFTTGLLVGIGETPRERVEALLALRSVHQKYGHIQELILQNFRAKPGIPMASHPHATRTDLLRTLALARLIFGGAMNVQAPPNLSAEGFPELLRAGINDWGGVSPVTPDHINPEAPWPHLETLARRTADAGYELRERLCVYPERLRNAGWTPPPGAPPALALAFGRLTGPEGFAHTPDPGSAA